MGGCEPDAIRRGLEQRIDYSFIKTYRPVIDDVAFRSWATTAEPRRRQAGLPVRDALTEGVRGSQMVIAGGSPC